MKSLGATLKEARELVTFTLKQVEEATQISTAYLSQLENDKIKKPSANILYKLANLYQIEMNALLIASGIIEKGAVSQKSKGDNEWVNRLAFYAGDFSEAQQEEVIEYIKYLKFKNKNG